MPTYDYQCEKCGHFEFTQSIKADALENCPSCGSSVQRLISNNIGIIFKGSGFYINDSRSKSAAGDTASTPSSDSKVS